MISARYWRLLAADVNWNAVYGDKTLSVFEIYYYETTNASGTNLPISAYAESTIYGASYAGKEYDGNIDTFWATQYYVTSYQWTSVDFGSAKSLSSFKIRHGIGPKKWDVQYSSDNNTNWTTLTTVNVASGSAIQTFTDLQAAAVGRPLIHGGLMSRPPQFGGLLMRN